MTGRDAEMLISHKTLIEGKEGNQAVMMTLLLWQWQQFPPFLLLRSLYLASLITGHRAGTDLPCVGQQLQAGPRECPPEPCATSSFVSLCL